MSDLAVIEASYSDFKLVRTRSAAQLILEIPIERAEEALRVFGIPQPGHEVRVAIALLKPPDNNVTALKADDNKKSERSKAAYAAQSDKEKAVTRAAMLCEDADFRYWLRNTHPEVCHLEAAPALRELLKIKSRRDIAFDRRAFEAFLDLEWQYQHRYDERAG